VRLGVRGRRASRGNVVVLVDSSLLGFVDLDFLLDPTFLIEASR
jgi:hypothetical protein